MRRKVLPVIMTIMMIITMIPAATFAEGENPNWESSVPLKVGEVYNSGERINLTNNLETQLNFYIKIYEDLEYTKLVTSGENEYTDVVVVASKGEYGPGTNDFWPDDYNIKLDEIVDNSSDSEAPSVTLTFHRTSAEMTEKNYADITEINAVLADKLSQCSGQKYNLKIANPENLGISGWDKDTALKFMSNYAAMAVYTGLDWVLKVNGTIISAKFDFYKDRELKNKVDFEEFEKLEEGKTYYIEISYAYDYIDGDIRVPNQGISIENPCEFIVEFVDVDSDSAEVAQIKKNIERKNKDIKIYYNDLSWINILANTGKDTIAPSIKNAGSIIKNRNEEIYKELVGDTNLEIKVGFGGMGDGDCISKGTYAGNMFYSVDDVLYFNDMFSYSEVNAEEDVYETNNGISIYMSNIIYVASGTKDRAKAAEDRIKSYMDPDNSNYDVKIAKLSPTELAEFAKKDESVYLDVYDVNWNAVDIKNAKAAYLTEYGIAFYNNEKKTDKENLMGIHNFHTTNEALPGSFDEMKIEKSNKTVDSLTYLKIDEETGEEKAVTKNNVAVYDIYKLQLNNDTAQEYLYLIGEKPERELENPLASWEDNDSGIITDGQNGQVIEDFYVRVSMTPEGIKQEIVRKINADKVSSYDIFGYTNFRSGQVTNLGNGRVEVKIPLNKIEKGKLIVFYYDKNGNIERLRYKIVKENGIEYVCFITNHFSTYGIAEVSDSSTDDGTISGNTGNTDQIDKSDKTKQADTSSNTGDSMNMFIPITLAGLALVAMAAIAVTRRRNN